MYQDLCIVPLATTTNGIVYQPTIFVRIDPNSRAQRINCDGMTRLFIVCSHPVHIFFLTRRSHLYVIALRCILACHGTILRFFAIVAGRNSNQGYYQVLFTRVSQLILDPRSRHAACPDCACEPIALLPSGTVGVTEALSVVAPAPRDTGRRIGLSRPTHYH